MEKPNTVSKESDRTCARRILSLIDLTSLNENDGEAAVQSIVAKCVEAHQASLKVKVDSDNDVPPHVAALCLWPSLLPIARQQLMALSSPSNILSRDVKLAAVVNFPSGEAPLPAVLDEVRQCLEFGADEVDLVFPYKRFVSLTPSPGEWKGETLETEICYQMVAQVKQLCDREERESVTKRRHVTLKVILETAELVQPNLSSDGAGTGSSEALARWRISLAALCAIAAGGDMVKTSTGKVKVGATREAVSVICEVLRWCGEGGGQRGGAASPCEELGAESPWNDGIGKSLIDRFEAIRGKAQDRGIKISGGIRTVADARSLMDVIEENTTSLWASSKRHVRIGASPPLLNDVMSHLAV